MRVRVQAMDERAESGMAAHSAYKGGLDYKQVRWEAWGYCGNRARADAWLWVQLAAYVRGC